MDNIPTPPEFNETLNANRNMIQNNNDLLILKLIHELATLNFYMSEIETSLRSIANEKQ